jgi:hypothetical protein
MTRPEVRVKWLPFVIAIAAVAVFAGLVLVRQRQNPGGASNARTEPHRLGPSESKLQEEAPVQVSLPEEPLDPGPNLMVVVLDSKSAPVQGARVTVEMVVFTSVPRKDPADLELEVPDQTVLKPLFTQSFDTDERGRCRARFAPEHVDGKPEPVARIVAEKPGFARADAYFASYQLPLRKVMILKQGAIIEGRVTDPFSRPIVSRLVVVKQVRTTAQTALRDEDHEALSDPWRAANPELRAQTNAQGEYRFDQLPLGLWFVGVRKESDEKVDGPSNFLSVREGASSRADFFVFSGKFGLKGSLALKSGEVVADAVLTVSRYRDGRGAVEGVGKPGEFIARTGPDGRFEFPPLPYQEVQVALLNQSGLELEDRGWIVLNPSQAVDLQLFAQSIPGLSGSILDSRTGAAPVLKSGEKLSIRLQRVGGGMLGHVDMNPDGTFKLNEKIQGRVLLIVTHHSPTPRWKQLVLENVTASAPLRLVLEPAP